VTSPSRPGLLELDLVAASDAVRAGEVDPVALTAAHLEHAAGSELNDWVTLDPDGALAAAGQAAVEIRDGEWRGPLHGLPVGVKDLFDTAGLRTTYGSLRFADHVPERDADVVTRLRDAGAVVLGKQATHEFAWGGRTDSKAFGPTRNPHDPTRIPGGSSGGGATAIVSGAGLLAVGSDTAGSVRIPAALSGCVGYKPSRDWCPLAGAFPLAPSLDHVGLITRTVADAATAFQALGGAPHEPRGAPLRVGLLVGESDLLLAPEVREAVHTAADRLGDAGEVVQPVVLTRVDERVRAILEVIRGEAEEVHRDAYRADPGSYGPDLAHLLSMGPISPHRRATVSAEVRRAVAEAEALLRSHDVLLSATVPITAPRIGQQQVTVAGRDLPVELLLTRLTSLADAGGMPALSVPFPTEQLPVGVHLVAARQDDGTLLAAGRVLERVLAEV
jgi:aspartyl-tRNA(Asn)/glutamyl-tRNA(Gln) amidotransferase subunit A